MSSVGSLQIGGGRKLPKLLFLTSREALGATVGEDAAAAVLQAASSVGVVYDALNAPKSGVSDIEATRNALRQQPDIEGIVILGGYDVVSGRVVDCLPPSIRQRIDVTRDPDFFYVWSDDSYGDRDGDGFPDLPVSRVPDAHNADFFMTCLAANGPPRPIPRKGFRNRLRPFADPIYALLPGADPMVTSLPTRVEVPPRRQPVR